MNKVVLVLASYSIKTVIKLVVILWYTSTFEVYTDWYKAKHSGDLFTLARELVCCVPEDPSSQRLAIAPYDTANIDRLNHSYTCKIPRPLMPKMAIQD